MKTLLMLFFTLGAVFAETLTIKTIAIMDFENHGPTEYNDFLKGVPDMMMTNLGNVKGLRVIERVQVEKALKAFNMENYGLTRENTVKIGQWLGADILVFGSMIKSNATIRFDARFIEAASGSLLAGSSVYGKESEVMYLIDALCEKISARFTGEEKPDTLRKATASPSAPPSPLPDILSPGALRINFKMFFSLLAEEKYFHERCRVYIDSREAKMSCVISETDNEYELFNDTLGSGIHSVEIIHYYVNKKGACVRKADDQPKVFLIRVLPGQTYTINYKLKIGAENRNEMVYDEKNRIRVF